ncbi:hypothetical protein SAMN04488029_1742 [Reichenbachiella faecimaris]|uniref:DUF2062 domain-containing protein n=1 Tax=Reichenbachiella faecimaris TaxID=692418 RepID=A0A1W2GB86_REIFA|nr:DUF2062 domain-containing protein [Reichenbachiella faecimaris]SMD33925.1 hypothetical protein SAMN04488029_1742 [Reichenbachiella faecimaris]
MKNYKNKFVFKLKRHFLEVLRTKTSDHSVAMGFAVGSFVAILPTPGISFLIGIGIVAIFKTINKYALFLAMVVWNIWTLAPIYWASYEIGEAIFGDVEKVIFDIKEWDQVFDYSLRFLIGNLFLSTPIAVLSYFLVRAGVRKYKRSRQ